MYVQYDVIQFKFFFERMEYKTFISILVSNESVLLSLRLPLTKFNFNNWNECYI